MRKTTMKILLAVAMLGLSLAACDDDDSSENTDPTFSEITVSPVKDVYKVGDVITCSITQETPPGNTLKESQYWWYASWWFSDPDLTADFQEISEDGVCSSSEIVLTEAGEVTLYFFGRLDFPQFDFHKIEIGKKITVVE